MLYFGGRLELIFFLIVKLVKGNIMKFTRILTGMLVVLGFFASLGLGRSLVKTPEKTEPKSGNAVKPADKKFVLPKPTVILKSPVGLKLPIRVVPNISHESENMRFDPKHKYSYLPMFNGSRDAEIWYGLIDNKTGKPVWLISPAIHYGYAPKLSHDMKKIYFVSPQGGKVYDIQTRKMKILPWLRGSVLLLSKDDKTMYLFSGRRSAGSRWGNWGNKLEVLNLDGAKLADYPVNVNVIHKAEFSDSEDSLSLIGGVGHGYGSCGGGWTFVPKTQTINFKSGKVTITQTGKGTNSRIARLEQKRNPNYKHPYQKEPEVKSFKLLKSPKKSIRQKLVKVYWDSNRKNIYISSMLNHKGIFVKWNLKDAKLMKSVPMNKLKYIQEFKPGVFIGTKWHDNGNLSAEFKKQLKKNYPEKIKYYHWGPYLTILNILDGTEKVLPLICDDSFFKISPDRQKILNYGKRFKLQIFDRKTNAIIKISPDSYKGKVNKISWLANNNILLITSEGNWSNQKNYTYIVSPEGKVKPAKYQLNPKQYSVSPSGKIVANVNHKKDKINNSEVSILKIFNVLTGKEITSVPMRMFNSIDKISFINDHIAIALGNTSMHSSGGWLIHISNLRRIWFRENLRSYNSHCRGDYICQKGDRKSTIVRLYDGMEMPLYSRPIESAWFRPTLIKRGKLAVDPICHSTAFELKDVMSGKVIATFANFENSEWIIYTPDGKWTGSDNAPQIVSFYKGLKPLSKKEIASLRNPKAVKKALAKYAGK